ncbi:myb-related protein A [Caerostris extrusa]|uniref:Myb-related protein A n=1 Tax=Caerostris extrusa TaxID=172846 RepID=A0AAV4YEH4_CAEEX|nr:myb-related protein A [Caerostris extrusa]
MCALSGLLYKTVNFVARTQHAIFRSKPVNKARWTKEEDEKLKNLVEIFAGEVLGLKKKIKKVVELVKKHGPQKWTLIAKQLRGRIGKQCRERWHNHLNPEIKNCMDH